MFFEIKNIFAILLQIPFWIIAQIDNYSKLLKKISQKIKKIFSKF